MAPEATRWPGGPRGACGACGTAAGQGLPLGPRCRGLRAGRREGARGERAVRTGASTQRHGRGAAFNAEHRRGSAGPRRPCRGCGRGGGPCARGRRPPAPPAAGTSLGLPGLRPVRSRRGSGRSGAAGGATPRSRRVPAGTALQPCRAEPAASGPRGAPAWPGDAEQGLGPSEPRGAGTALGQVSQQDCPAVTGQTVLLAAGSPAQWHSAGTGRSWLCGSAAASSSVAPTVPDGKVVLGCHTSPGLRPSPKTAAAGHSPAVLGRRDEPGARRTRRCRSRWCCAGDTTGCTPHGSARLRGAARPGPTWTRAPRGTRRSTQRSPAPGPAAAAAARPPPPGTAAAAGRAGVTAAPGGTGGSRGAAVQATAAAHLGGVGVAEVEQGVAQVGAQRLEVLHGEVRVPPAWRGRGTTEQAAASQPGDQPPNSTPSTDTPTRGGPSPSVEPPKAASMV